MAVYENNTQNYIKVDESKSFVQNKMIFVAHTVYATLQDRQHEKDRRIDFERFDINAKQMIDSLSSQNQVERAELINWAVNQVKNNRYLTASTKEVAFTEDIHSLLVACGYDEQWLVSPIQILSTKIVNCGRYNGETITREFLYQKLKNKMSRDIQDI